MKAQLTTVILILSTLLTSACPLPGNCADKEWDKFWIEFKQALQKKDKEAIASLTALPYMLDEKKLDRKQFISQFDSLFDQKTRNCIVKQKPVLDQKSYMVFCGEEIFIFSKVSGKYRFVEIGVND